MYFIVRFSEANVVVIVPQVWILDIERHWEKFVNFSMNKNQKFLCFYSVDMNAAPDFTTAKIRNFPATGLYEANLLYYKGKN